MARVTATQSVFNAGEITPLLHARDDLKAYRNGVATLENFIPMVQGAATLRGGSYFAGEVRDHTNPPRLVPFKYSTTDAYILEWGDEYVKFWTNHGPVLEATVNISAATKANPCVVTANSHGYNNGDQVYITGVLGMTELNGRTFTVANKTANTFQLSGVNSTNYTTYTSAGTVARIYKVTTPYDILDVPELSFAQSADVLYIAHGDYPPMKLVRAAATSWTISEISFIDGPYLPENADSTKTFSASGTSGSVTITAAGHAPFVSTDVGRFMRFEQGSGLANPGSTWWVIITAYTSSTVVTATIQPEAQPSAGTVAGWRFGAWSDTTGYPTCVTFHEDRLVFGGEPAQRISASNSGDYENFAPDYKPTYGAVPTITDSCGYNFSVSSDDVNRIRSVTGTERGLFIGTYGDEWVMRPSLNNEAISPTNVKALPTTKLGLNFYQPIKADGAVLFIARTRKTLHEFGYNFDTDSFRSPDMTIIAEHITGDGIKYLAYQQAHDKQLWTVRDDGALIGFVYDRDQQVTGWHRHWLGGYSDSGTTPAAVTSVASIPSPDGSRDEIWLVVKRYINGGTKYYVEYLSDRWHDGDTLATAYFVDGGLQYDGSPATTISGLWHLEGASVTILADGAVHPNKTVASGAITLDYAASQVSIGFGYTATLLTLPIEAGALNGSNQGKYKRINRVVTRLWQSAGGSIGPDADNLIEFKTRVEGEPMDEPPAIFTGDRDVLFEGKHIAQAQVCLVQDKPLPFTILGITADIETSDRN